MLARPVVIKFIASVEPDLAARQRFLMEARAAARIQHPNVVAVYRVGELGDRPFIVSELLRGRLLAELPRPMPCPRVLSLGVELARGLAAAHRRSVVHCDVKPSNVIVGDDGTAKLFDFGWRGSSRMAMTTDRPRWPARPTTWRPRSGLVRRRRDTPTCMRSARCCTSWSRASRRSATSRSRG